MKKLILFILLCFHFVVLFAQQDVTTFLGIPVDGTKSEMIEKLKEKGFVCSAYSDDILQGEFNGEEVEIKVLTVNNRVWRIALRDKYSRSEQQIKIRYNKLCEQFSNNKRYTSYNKAYTSFFQNLLSKTLIPYLSSTPSKDSSYVIPYDEDISYEMSVNEKVYQAIFCQNPDTVIFFNNPILQKECPNVYKMFLNIGYSGLSDTSNNAMYEYCKELSMEEDVSVSKEGVEAFFLIFKKSVCFQIFSRDAGYYIMMCYDNEYNKTHGEDL